MPLQCFSERRGHQGLSDPTSGTTDGLYSLHTAKLATLIAPTGATNLLRHNTSSNLKKSIAKIYGNAAACR